MPDTLKPETAPGFPVWVLDDATICWGGGAGGESRRSKIEKVMCLGSIPRDSVVWCWFWKCHWEFFGSLVVRLSTFTAGAGIQSLDQESKIPTKSHTAKIKLPLCSRCGWLHSNPQVWFGDLKGFLDYLRELICLHNTKLSMDWVFQYGSCLT